MDQKLIHYENLCANWSSYIKTWVETNFYSLITGVYVSGVHKSKAKMLPTLLLRELSNWRSIYWK